jgi:nifR3 family TIM-barrel protein
MTLKIGHLDLSSNLCLAPLAGYTGLPFRVLIREIGGVGLCTTDLVNARSLLEKNKKAWELVRSGAGDEPLSVQLYGTIPEELRDAAVLLQERGVAVVDVNMGCPVRKICKNGGGSALLGDIAKAARLAGAMVAGLKIPVTCKVRLGVDADNITAPELARALEDVGVAAVTVHGRTKAQGFTGKVNLAGIAAVVAAVRRIPVIGNGDVTTPVGAKQMLDVTGCAGVSIGRGAFYNPRIFEQTRQYLDTGVLPAEPSFEERLRLMTLHLDRMIAWQGEEQGCLQFRKVAIGYARAFGPVVEFRKRVVRLKTRAELDAILAEYKPWRERILATEKHRHKAVAAQVPVPTGANELW